VGFGNVGWRKKSAKIEVDWKWRTRITRVRTAITRTTRIKQIWTKKRISTRTKTRIFKYLTWITRTKKQEQEQKQKKLQSQPMKDVPIT